MKILITGTAGFIGYSVSKNLLLRGDTVIGIDNINDYYDVGLKYARIADAGISKSAAQVTGRFSMESPYTWLNSNFTGLVTVLEACQHHNIN